MGLGRITWCETIVYFLNTHITGDRITVNGILFILDSFVALCMIMALLV